MWCSGVTTATHLLLVTHHSVPESLTRKHTASNDQQTTGLMAALQANQQPTRVQHPGPPDPYSWVKR